MRFVRKLKPGAGLVTTVADILGAATVAAGAALIYLPAGLVVAGALTMVLSYLAAD